MDRTKFPRTELDQQAFDLAQHILDEMGKTGSCEDLLWEWTQEHLWGHRVKEQIPQFKELYDYCVEHGHKSSNTAVWYGDDDVAVWYVPLKDDDRKILIMRNVCTCRDDNIYVYIYDNIMDKYPDEKDEGDYETFLSTNVYERQKLRKGHKFGDARDIVNPSLATLKRLGYKDFGYEDKNHNFMYRGMDGKVDKAYWVPSNIRQSLMELDFAHNNIIVQEDGRS